VFERSDDATRALVDVAVEESRRRGHNWLGTEHVLLAMVQRVDLLPSEIAALLPDAQSVASALDGALGPARPETDLLKVVGIDLEQVRSAVRRTFGESALEELGRRRVHQAWQPWRRPTRRCMSILAGSMSVAPRVKRAFARARYHAERRQLVAIDPATLLLGMVEVKDALSNRILRDLGVDFERLRARLQVT
jgi:ATP-dependent Clp protease ATP-binding subunit ClpA